MQIGIKSVGPTSREWANQCRRNQARWQAHNTGKTWVLDIVNRTTGQVQGSSERQERLASRLEILQGSRPQRSKLGLDLHQDRKDLHYPVRR